MQNKVIFLKVALLVLMSISGLAFAALTVVAYVERFDKSFSGGSSILTGWWLIMSPSDLGLGEESKRILAKAGG